MSKVTIITGPASGIIGRTVVISFLTEGAFVWAPDTDCDHFVALSQKISSSQLRTQTSSATLWLCQ
jgi:NADP-dependent 3-hydroxy acid dehydrogenase YdfG